MLKIDSDAGENPETRYVAPENILPNATDDAQRTYLNYLHAVMDTDAVQKTDGNTAVNPDGILYMTANSSSGSKYYDLVPRMQSYIAKRWQEDVPTYSIVNMTDDSLTINTYRTDNGEAIDDSFTIKKTDESTLPFTDVNRNDWFYSAVNYAYQNKLFSGMSETTFAPNVPMSRAMLVQVLYNMAGKPEVSGTSSFRDVGSAWYQNAVTWASQNGIVYGTGKHTFSPESAVTREQTAAILQRYMQKTGKDTSASADLSKYPDAASVSAWAKDSMQWAVGSGLIEGVRSGSTVTLSPQDSSTRAQIAQMLYNFFK